MKNILYLHAGAEMYGADKILLELVTGLDKTKFNPIVILPNEGILKEKLQKKGINTYVINYPILRRKYFNLKGIVNYVIDYFKYSEKIVNFLKSKDIKVNIIHVNTTAVLEGIYLKKRLHAKMLWHVHEIILKPKIIFKIICWLIGKYSDKCITVSKAVKEHLIKSGFIPKEKIQVIYNGIDENVFNPSVNYDYLFDEFKIPRNSIRIGMIGRVNSWKGQNDFIDAVSPLLTRYENLYAFIVGSAFEGEEWRVDKLKEKIREQDKNNKIIYSSFREDNAAIQNFFDILVLPSTNPDPLPTVVLEAMACAKPVVGYAHGGITEMVHQGVNGYLAAPNVPEDLANKIKLLVILKSKIKNLGTNSLEIQKEFFSINSFLINFSKIYDLMN